MKKQEERETGGTGCVTFLTLLQFPVRKQIIIAIIMLKYLLLPLLRRIMLRETDSHEETESASVNCKHDLLQ